MPQAALPTTLSAIGYALQAALVAAGTAVAPSPSCVIFSRAKRPFPAMGYPQIVITREGFAAVPGWFEGGGLATSCLAGTVSITINVRSAADQQEQDQYRLNGNPALIPPVLGLEDYAHAVANALHGQFLADATGNFLTVEPLSLKGSASPVDYGDEFPECEGISLDFRVMFLPDYTSGD